MLEQPPCNGCGLLGRKTCSPYIRQAPHGSDCALHAQNRTESAVLMAKCDTRELDTDPSSEFMERAAVCWQMPHAREERLDPSICPRTLPRLLIRGYRTRAPLLPLAWEPAPASSPLHAAISGFMKTSPQVASVPHNKLPPQLSETPLQHDSRFKGVSGADASSLFA